MNPETDLLARGQEERDSQIAGYVTLSTVDQYLCITEYIVDPYVVLCRVHGVGQGCPWVSQL